MDFEAYKDPDKSELIRDLKYAVEVYSEILTLQKPLLDLAKIQKDTEEYTTLSQHMAQLDFYTHVKYYIDNYDTWRLGDLMEMHGNNIDNGYGYSKLPNGRTTIEEHKIVTYAWRINKQRKLRDFKKLYKYLTENGAKDLIKFKTREASNATLKAQALSKCKDGDPKKQEALVERKLSKFRHQSYCPSVLYFAAYKLSKHLSSMIATETSDEFVETYYTDYEREGFKNRGNLNINTHTLDNLPRVEAYIKDIATGKIKLSEVPVKISNEDENQL